MDKIILAISSALGFGYFPVASGTAGSIPGVMIAYAFWKLAGAGSLGSPAYLALIAILLAVGIWVSGRAEVIYGKKDCGKIVIDEVVGMMITLAFLPASWFNFAVGFFLFRLFDVLKPYPANWINDHMGGGKGVMLDDVAAGIYANIGLVLINRLHC